MVNFTRPRCAAIGATVAVVLGAAGFAGAATSSDDGSVLVMLESPCRILDTRAADPVGPRSTPLGAGEEYQVTAHGEQGDCVIPADATGLSLNVTALNQTAATFLTVYRTGDTRPTASNLNPTPGEPPTPNAVTTGLDATGRFSIFNRFGVLDVIADVIGYYTGHDHDDRYYTETESDERYYTRTQADARYATHDHIDAAIAAIQPALAPTALAFVEAAGDAYRSSQGFTGLPSFGAGSYRLTPVEGFALAEGDMAVVTPMHCDAGASVMFDVESLGGDMVVHFEDAAGATRQCDFTIAVFDASVVLG